MNISIWVEAARLRTLPASLVPVLTGAVLAAREGFYNLTVTFITLLCAILIQIATNFANDYFDFRNGADTSERVGFVRASSSGLIDPATMLKMALATFGIAFLLGLYLVIHAGWPILIIGILSIICGLLYTGGPFPLAYNGLGEVFVFIFFGFAAVMGTYYVHALHWSIHSFWAAIPIGALSTQILVVNNYRDVRTDRSTGKTTLTVLLGERFSRWQFLGLYLLAFAIPPHFFFRESFGAAVLLPMILIPWAIRLTRKFWIETDKHVFNNLLVHSAQFMTLFGLLFAAGIVLG